MARAKSEIEAAKNAWTSARHFRTPFLKPKAEVIVPFGVAIAVAFPWTVGVIHIIGRAIPLGADRPQRGRSLRDGRSGPKFPHGTQEIRAEEARCQNADRNEADRHDSRKLKARHVLGLPPDGCRVTLLPALCTFPAWCAWNGRG